MESHKTQDHALQKRHTMMTTTPVSRLIGRLAIPTIVSMIVTALYNMADTYFVGQINTTATGAVGVVFPIMTSIQVIGMTLGVGSGSFVARLLGQKKGENANQVVSTAFFTALACGTVFALLGELFSEPFLRLLGSTETILPYAKQYAFYIFLGAPFMAASFVMNVNLRSEGSAMLAMAGLATGALLNIILDPLFIFTFRLGIAGAAIATVLSQIVSFFILLSHYTQKRSTLKIHPKNIRLQLSLFTEIGKSGTATLFRQSLVTVAAVILNATAKNYGDAAIASMTIVNRISMFIGSALIGLGQGFQPVAAFNYSAEKYSRVHQAFWFTVRTAFIGLMASSIFAFFFSPTIIRLFRNDPEVIKMGALALRVQCITIPFNSYMVASNMMFQYIGKPWKATIISMSRQGFMFVPSLIILSTRLGFLGVQLSQPVADALSLFLTIPLTAKTLQAFKANKTIA